MIWYVVCKVLNRIINQREEKLLFQNQTHVHKFGQMSGQMGGNW
jgi:hypothetical protein